MMYIHVIVVSWFVLQEGCTCTSKGERKTMTCTLIYGFCFCKHELYPHVVSLNFNINMTVNRRLTEVNEPSGIWSRRQRDARSACVGS